MAHLAGESGSAICERAEVAVAQTAAYGKFPGRPRTAGVGSELRRSPLRVFHKGRSIKRRNAFARLLTPTTIHIQIFAK